VDPAEHARHTREVYDRLAPVWSTTTDDGPFNGLLERPALRSLVPRPLKGMAVLDVGCGSGAQCAWLLDEGADVTGVDLSPMMIEQARQRCGSRANLLVADMAEPLPFEPQSFDGMTCSLALHYLRDWQVPLTSFARILRPGGWAVISLDHPFGAPLPDQRDGYFQRQLVSDSWTKADVQVTQHFWRRPLAQVVDAFAEAGFVVERIVEPRPSPEAILRYPMALQNVVDSPSFIVYRLRYSGAPE
jgi:ubiquinone/menaquinone biosynthesis C-methylase UbiE